MRDSKGRFIKGHKVPKKWRDIWRKTKYPTGKERYNWKGGIVIQKGYRFVTIDGKYVQEQRVVWCQESDWGFIPHGFIVHHRNGDKLDNRIENLACIPRDIHIKIHNPIETRWARGEI